MKLPSPYQTYTTEAGLPGVRVRRWHPAIFIPDTIRWLRYWRGAPGRYREYENALGLLYGLDPRKITKTEYDALVKTAIKSVDCGYICGWSGEYGFVPEADCPIHDV